MKYFLGLFALSTIALSACANPSNSESVLLETKGVAEASAETKISVDLPDDRVVNIALETPSGALVILHDTTPNSPTLWPAGAQPDILNIYPKNTAGVQWKDGLPESSAAFETPGEYKIIVAENLETEPENTYWIEYRFRLKD